MHSERPLYHLTNSLHFYLSTMTFSTGSIGTEKTLVGWYPGLTIEMGEPDYDKISPPQISVMHLMSPDTGIALYDDVDVLEYQYAVRIFGSSYVNRDNMAEDVACLLRGQTIDVYEWDGSTKEAIPFSSVSTVSVSIQHIPGVGVTDAEKYQTEITVIFRKLSSSADSVSD